MYAYIRKIHTLLWMLWGFRGNFMNSNPKHWFDFKRVFTKSKLGVSPQQTKGEGTWRTTPSTLLWGFPAITSWWLNQPSWKICSSNWIISPNRGENEKYLKPPTRLVSGWVNLGVALAEGRRQHWGLLDDDDSNSFVEFIAIPATQGRETTWWINLEIHMSHEKTPLTFHYTGCLIEILRFL